MTLTPEDLQTTREEYAAGFRDLVLTKSERLTPHERSRTLARWLMLGYETERRFEEAMQRD